MYYAKRNSYHVWHLPIRFGLFLVSFSKQGPRNVCNFMLLNIEKERCRTDVTFVVAENKSALILHLNLILCTCFSLSYTDYQNTLGHYQSYWRCCCWILWILFEMLLDFFWLLLKTKRCLASHWSSRLSIWKIRLAGITGPKLSVCISRITSDLYVLLLLSNNFSLYIIMLSCIWEHWRTVPCCSYLLREIQANLMVLLACY